MIPIDQTIFCGVDGPRKGNCLQACVASVLELQLCDVPHFLELGQWFFELDRFLATFGLAVVRVDLPASPHESPIAMCSDETPYLVAGKSPRGDWLHQVIYEAGRLIHDPHPSRIGIVGRPRDYMFFVPRTRAGLARVVRESRP